MEKVSITTSLLNTIVQYLANRPYIEVANLIERIQTELKPKEPENESSSTPSKDSEGL